MSDLRTWLESLGLGDYAEAFEAERIALRHVTELSDADLKDLGLPMGPRKELLKAARDLAEAGAPTTATKKVESADAMPRVAEAERRQITVMFCDLVGSTSLSEDMDPEDLRAVMQAYQQAAGGVIERYEGHVAQYLGDGLMTYFGWPSAHEDDGERAVRAGMEIIEAIKGVEAPHPLQARVGIATGPVVVGETGAGDASVPKLAVGETPNLAARVQGLAGPDEIVISPATRRLVGATFVLADMGSHSLKGIVEPVQAWRVTGFAATEGRFEATRGAHLTPFVGRESEVAQLTEAWQQACAGEGQVVLLCGEPGIGKSRILQEVRRRIEKDAHTRLRYQCSPYHTSSALHPVIEQFLHAVGFEATDDTDAKLTKIEALTGNAGHMPALFASLLGIDSGERYAALNMTPQKQKDETLNALAEQIAMLAGTKPVLMLFEDAHWIDPTTQEALDLIVPWLADKRVLLLITYRPEYAPPWPQELAHLTSIGLARLDQRNVAEMVARVTGGRPLPDEVVDQIVAKTDGVPLFVEELTRTILEAGILEDAGDEYELDGPLPPLAIPSTLQDSLMARLDRLSPVKEVAQIGSCIGREFSYDLLAAVSPLGDNELGEVLTQLTNSELVFARGELPQTTYVFKHALVQDAAYGSLLKSRRASLHKAIAESLEAGAQAEPEILAHHYSEAGLMDKAVPYWLAAAEAALARSALQETVNHSSRALTDLLTQPASATRDESELQVRMVLGAAYLGIKGWAASETLEIFGAARELAISLDQPEPLKLILWCLWSYYGCRAEYADGAKVVHEMLDRIGEDLGSDLAVCARAAGIPQELWSGNLQQSADHLQSLREHYDFDRHKDLVHGLTADPLSVGQCWGAQALWMLGWPDQAAALCKQVQGQGRRLGHPFNLAMTMTVTPMALAYRGETGDGLDWLEEAREIGREQSLPVIDLIMYPLWGGNFLVARGFHEEGVELISTGIENWNALGGNCVVPISNMFMAVGLGRLGRHDEAMGRIDLALDQVAATGERMAEAEIHRVKGDLLLHGPGGDGSVAEQCFERAIDVARGQSARGWELRAASSLAHLWGDSGERQKAHDLLAPVYDWFTEGFETKDLKDASALLDQLI